jgi:hypothetical protein
MASHGRRRTSLVKVAAVLAASGALAACGSRSPRPAATTPAVSLPSASVSPSPSGVAAGVAAVHAAVSAYSGMWKAYDAAIKIPDPQASDLVRYATGEALQTLTKGLQSVKEQGLKGTGDFVLAPRVSEVSPVSAPTNVGVRDCLSTAATHLVRVGPGSPYHDTPGGRRLCTATVVLQPDGTWKVTQFTLQKVGTC